MVKFRVLASDNLDESWGAALKESGLEFEKVSEPTAAGDGDAACFLVDARDSSWISKLTQFRENFQKPILGLVSDQADRALLLDLKAKGVSGYFREGTPSDELVVRVKTLVAEAQKRAKPEGRAAQRVWYQTPVDFKVFDKDHRAWSTTLSETGIFLRTQLSFPLYTLIQLKFSLLADPRPFECNAVIVRQEAEGEVRGLGVMFQNLRGEDIRRLESFLELYR